MQIEKDDILTELRFKATRSSGKGGQNVNKVSSRVELYFDIAASTILSEKQKQILLKKLANKISKEGILQVNSESERSQLMNRQLALDKLLDMVNAALKPIKRRKATKPSKASIEKRISDKKSLAQKKKERKDTGMD